MAQQLKPNRSDNRGGFKPKTSTKIRFNYRIEPEYKELLTEIAIYLNNLPKAKKL